MKSRWSRDSPLTAPPMPITSSGRPHLLPLIDAPIASEASMSVKAMISVLPSFQLQRPNTPRSSFQRLFDIDDIAVLGATGAGL